MSPTSQYARISRLTVELVESDTVIAASIDVEIGGLPLQCAYRFSALKSSPEELSQLYDDLSHFLHLEVQGFEQIAFEMVREPTPA
jgi:hypothetical protein